MIPPGSAQNDFLFSFFHRFIQKNLEITVVSPSSRSDKYKKIFIDLNAKVIVAKKLKFVKWLLVDWFV